MIEHLKDIKIEDLPESFRELAETIGLDTALLMVELFGGQNIYFPKLENITQPARYRAIYDEYKESKSGRVYAELARKYDYSESHVRALIRAFKAGRLTPPEQQDLF